MREQKPYTVFIVFSRTHSYMGKLIRLLSKCEYNHVSISFSEDLQPLFSFARYHVNEPFIGGFVEESWLRYLHNNMDISVKVFAVPLGKEQYRNVINRLGLMRNNKGKYLYDMRGIFLKRWKRENHFTCLSFAAKLLRDCNVITGGEEIGSIDGLSNSLAEYRQEERVISVSQRDAYCWGSDEFYIKSSKRMILKNHIRCYTPLMRVKRFASVVLYDKAL